MSDDVHRIDDGFAPLLPHRHDATAGAPFRARLAAFEGHAERLDHGWRWRGRLASDDVAELLGSGVRGRSQRLVGPAGDAVAVRLADVWFDAESGSVCCDLVERTGDIGREADAPDLDAPDLKAPDLEAPDLEA